MTGVQTCALPIFFDFKELEYLSSSGLRLLFGCRKKLGGSDKVIVRNVNPLITEVMKVTGFDKQITIE